MHFARKKVPQNMHISGFWGWKSQQCNLIGQKKVVKNVVFSGVVFLLQKENTQKYNIYSSFSEMVSLNGHQSYCFK